MSEPGCPAPDISCDACFGIFLDEHPGAERFMHTFHVCGCPFIADTGEVDVCVGCGERRDAGADWLERQKGRAA